MTLTYVMVMFVSAGLALTAISARADEPAEKRADLPTAKETPPTLDDLLGLPKADAKKDGKKSDSKEERKVVDPTRAALDRKLSDAEAAEQFEQAVALMGDTATRLSTARDAGLATQRLQEDILRKLDAVITQAENNRQQKKSSSTSQQQQQQQQSSQSQQQQQQSQARANQRNSDSQQDAPSPPRQEGALNPELAGRGQAWGALPQRVREALVQGNADKYSSLYQRWTEEYYKRLAEEKK